MDDVIAGGFRDPTDFVFWATQQYWELERYPDLKQELLKRKIQAGIDSGPGRPAEEVFAELKAETEAWKKEEPAI